jgi:hypothetical protein
MDLHRHPLDPSISVELNSERDPAPAGRRAKFGAAILSVQRVRLPQRGREAQNFGRVERSSHSFRHVVPEGPSSKMMPSALSSSRIRSAAAKSRFFFA